MGDPFATPCDRCGVDAGAAVLTLIVKFDNGYREHRGTYCSSECADASEADGSVMEHRRMPTTGEVVRALSTAPLHPADYRGLRLCLTE